MVVVPAGTFTMGSPESENLKTYVDEGPQHEVTIARPFAAGRFEITFEEWDACVSAGGCSYSPPDSFRDYFGRGGSKPVSSLSWHDARSYVEWLSKTTGRTYRLFTESEWEYAARAGTTTPYPTGMTLTTADASVESRWFGPIKVGSFKANAFGLHDMHGNVSEWVEDCYSSGWMGEDGYKGAPTDGSASTSGVCNERVLRGGYWESQPGDARSAKRWFDEANERLANFGLRVARTLVP
jgi:formylglycine-generating enzyme required for sulfatase activity